MKTTAAFALLIVTLAFVPTAQADTFGSGANEFDIEFVTIDDPDNPADDDTANPDFAGSVPYTYRMGKFAISEDMINKANNEGGLGITKDTRGTDKPATSVNWFEAAQFVNWLNEEKGASPAYKFNGSTIELWQAGDAGFDPNNPFRNSQAFYFLPSTDEWYKAAYYDPNAGGYYNYPTGSDSPPTAVASGTAAGTAVYDQPFNQGPADITLAGGLSPYGTMGQGGNVYEWEETEFDLVNSSSSAARGVRGGFWDSSSDFFLSSNRFNVNPATESSVNGFRVASVPEPSTLLMGALASVGLIARRRRPPTSNEQLTTDN